MSKWKNEGRRSMFLSFFLFDLEGLTPLPTYPKEWDQNQVVHSQKLFGGLGWF